MNVGKRRVVRCSRCSNGGRVHVIQGGEPLGEVDCFECLGSQVAAGGGCEGGVVRVVNEGCRAWRGLKGVLSNRGLGIRTRKWCLYEGVIVPAALCGEYNLSSCSLSQLFKYCYTSVILKVNYR